MEEEILIITIRQDFQRVYSYEITLYKGHSIGITEVPPGILTRDYRHMQIEIQRKEVIRP